MPSYREVRADPVISYELRYIALSLVDDKKAFVIEIFFLLPLLVCSVLKPSICARLRRAAGVPAHTDAGASEALTRHPVCPASSRWNTNMGRMFFIVKLHLQWCRCVRRSRDT